MRLPKLWVNSKAGKSNIGLTDKYGNVQLAIGKTSFEPSDLVANFSAVMDEIERARPASTKGRYIKKVTLSSTMGPGIKVDPSRLGD